MGKGQKRRAYKMLSRNPHHTAVQKALKKKGLAVDVRIVRCGLTEAEAFELEIQHIRWWRASGIRLTNRTDGGEGPSGLPAHNRQPVTCLNDGNVYPSVTEAAKSYGLNTVTVHDVCAGKYRSANGLHFIAGASNLGAGDRRALILDREKYFAGRRKRTEVKPQNGSIATGLDAKGRRAAGPMSRAKAVVCLDDGREFYSLSDAARFYGLQSGHLSKTLNGRQNRRTAGGLRFAFKEAA